MAKFVEYQVRPVTRYTVTKFTRDDETKSGGIETFGEFLNENIALIIKSALQRDDPDWTPSSLPSESA